ncbi:hypothetical protein GCM10010377_72930 [Streptomyces viridiviolaceus]|nr:hypothetical protein GCM10010377_72930 [Streptomyces viridiviolaceus]
MPTYPRPPFDLKVEAALTALAEPIPAVTPGSISALRQAALPVVSDEVLLAAGVMCRDVTVPGHRGAELVASVITRSGHTGAGPGVYHIHGGGMIAGERMTGVSQILPWIVEHDAVVVTVEYRLAPEFPDPCPVEECYAGLVWIAEHAAELGIAPGRLIIAGASAGGGLAAGTALLARDRKGPALIGQVLICPMLDDRDRTVLSPVPSTRTSASGSGRATGREGRRCWATGAAPRRCRSTPRPLARPTSRDCHPRSSTAVRPNFSGTRTSPTRPPSGTPACRPSCTYGPAATTDSTCSRRTPASHGRRSRPGTGGPARTLGARLPGTGGR